MTDTSRDMLWHAAQKHEKQSPQLQAKFCLADAQNLLSEPSSGIPGQDISDIEGSQSAAQQKLQTFRPAQFDTVVDTFGLCSHADPRAALQQMAAVCKPEGKLILLEHGKASWDFLNSSLDQGAQGHFAKWGCWWNRDILQLVNEAGLEVQSCSRWHFGTTYMITAHPPQKIDESKQGQLTS